MIVYSSFLAPIFFSASAIDAASVCGPAVAIYNYFGQVCMLKERKERTTEHRGSLEWSFEVTLGWFPEYMNSDNLCIIQVLQAHKGLDKEGLSILHVYVEEGHHGDTKVCTTKLEHMDKCDGGFNQAEYIRVSKSRKDRSLLRWL